MWWATDDEASAGSSRSCTVLAARIESTIITLCMNQHFPRATSQHLKGEHTCTSPEIVLQSICIFCSWWVGQVESN